LRLRRRRTARAGGPRRRGRGLGDRRRGRTARVARRRDRHRSEERRVGEECRYGGWRGVCKENRKTRGGVAGLDDHRVAHAARTRRVVRKYWSGPLLRCCFFFKQKTAYEIFT